MTGKRIITVPTLTAGFALVWSLFVINPWTDVFLKNPVIYAPMVELVPYEAFWGSIYLVVGIAALILAWKDRTRMQALLVAVAFMAFAALYFIADVASPAWALYLLLSTANLTIFWAKRWDL